MKVNSRFPCYVYTLGFDRLFPCEELPELGVDSFDRCENLPGSLVPLLAFSEGNKCCRNLLLHFKNRLITSVTKRKTYATVRQLTKLCFASQKRDTATRIVDVQTIFVSAIKICEGPCMRQRARAASRRKIIALRSSLIPLVFAG